MSELTDEDYQALWSRMSLTIMLMDEREREEYEARMAARFFRRGPQPEMRGLQIPYKEEEDA